MKRLASLIFCFLILASCFPTVQATSAETSYEDYTINNPCYLKIKIPTGFLVFWRDMPSNAPAFSHISSTPEHWNELFAGTPDILYAIDQINGKTILLSIDDRKMPEDSFKREPEVKNYIRAMLYPQGKEAGNKNEIYTYGFTWDFNFIKTYFTSVDNTDVIRAMFVHDQKLVTLNYISINPLSVKDMEIFDTILCSVFFDDTLKYSMITREEDFDPNTPENRLYEYQDMDFRIPNDYIVYDIETDENNLFLAMQGIPLRQVKSILNAEQIVSFATKYHSELSLTIKINPIEGTPEFTESNKKYLETLKEPLGKLFERNDFMVSENSLIESKYYNPETHEDNTLLWLKYAGHNRKQNMEEIIYTTIVNDTQFTVDVKSPVIEDDTANEADNIIESTYYWLWTKK